MITINRRTIRRPGFRRALESAQLDPWRIGLESNAWRPPMDIMEDNHGYLIRLEIAGVVDNQIGITVHRNQIKIEGVRLDTSGGKIYHQMEIVFGQFEFLLVIPPDGDSRLIEAAYDKGFLTISIPKILINPIKVSEEG